MPTADNVHLRPVVATDLPLMCEMQLDPESNRLAVINPRTPDAFFAHWAQVLQNPRGKSRAILAGDTMVGTISCFHRDEQDNVGYWIAREHWGKGYASRALQLLLEEVSERPLYAYAAIGNPASLRVLLKCGFVVKEVIDAPATERFPACKESVCVLE